ncbi:UbiH/UbiF family hydroxylase [Mesorhizobium sp. RP14(2022)]|uniref:UbiH/UbiF family hydroxylase n=1 Tax=Mesorhizobium liriopis TaxID=2953882 RepID=A0ABT1C754_9HYPH|nr:UbiH/UbiF family hydroxylase [Mesorhizobium liriopis]MCO6050654.1 UbiH/UbiF family hydroxylase [Mesorhizobium liriopis]
MTDRSFDIMVVGAGPVGSLAAVALARHGFAVGLIGPEAATDRRTTAIMTPALQWLDELGLATKLQVEGAPLRVMRIVDATTRLVRSPPVTFRASEIGEDGFGLNVPNAILNRDLADAVAQEAGIERLTLSTTHWLMEGGEVAATLSDGTLAKAKLVVAADGRMSPARQAAGIGLSKESLPQSALVLNFAHSRDHGYVSTEFHTETGPFTQVPLPGRRSSLVWVENPERAASLEKMGADELSRAVESKMQSMLGEVKVEDGRQVYPLSSALPRAYAARRVMLAGEAAHVFPPIGAQGLNLGIRDIRDIVSVVESNRDDPGSDGALSAYDRKRRLDVVSRSAGVGLLNRSLLSGMLPMQIGRHVALSALDRWAPLRGFAMRMGLGGAGRKSA